VRSALYHVYKQHESNPIPYDDQSRRENAFNNDQRELLDEVYQVFGQFSAWKLRDMTHEEPPWMDHEKEADIIPINEMTEYFKTRIN